MLDAYLLFFTTSFVSFFKNDLQCRIVVPKEQVLLAPLLIEPGAAHTYNTSGYNDLVSRRPAYLRAVLQAASQATEHATKVQASDLGPNRDGVHAHDAKSDANGNGEEAILIRQIRVLYADVDTVFLQNPLPLFDVETDLQIQSDADSPRKYCTTH